MRALTLLALCAPSLAFAGWHEDVKTAVADCATDPAPCDLANDVFIRETRAGTWMVQDPRIDASITPHLLDRLDRETDEKLRTALADGLAQLLLDDDTDTWHAAWVELASSDRDGGVREVLIHSLRRAPEGAAVPGLRAALKSDDALTRERAASIMGRSTHAEQFVDDLVAVLQDTEPTVRATAVKALGHTGQTRALPAVQALASDEAVAEVLPRAIERLSPE